MANILYTHGITRWSLFADSATPYGLSAKVALVEAGYSDLLEATKRVHVTMDDITSEVADVSYERQPLMNQDETVNDTIGAVVYSADTIVFPSLDSPNPITGVILYCEEGLAVDDTDTTLLAYWDIVPRIPNGTDFIITWNVNGIMESKQA